MTASQHTAAAAEMAAAARTAFRSGDLDRAERAARSVDFHTAAAACKRSSWS
jgi:hypothetical protein